MNHSLAFTASYSIARNAFQDDTTAGKISVLCHNNLLEMFHFLSSTVTKWLCFSDIINVALRFNCSSSNSFWNSFPQIGGANNLEALMTTHYLTKSFWNSLT